MSNKLVKSNVDQDAVVREQRAQYACIFALASKMVASKGGVILMHANEINQINTRVLRFEAANEDGSPFVPTEDPTQYPEAVKIWIEDPMTAQHVAKSLDA